jgi:toxin ParE1/3/4
MAYTIKLAPQALEDIETAQGYYDKQQLGMSNKFMSALNKSFNVLRKNPFFPVSYDQVRCQQPRPFPYLIHFTIDDKEKTVVVVMVMKISA